MVCRCHLGNEDYGVAESIRQEDLENVAKLKSLLRGLYHKKMPKACKKHNMVLCTSNEQGWCIYIQDKPVQGSDQRCSCNVGFYGEACQFRMCPGLGKTLYQADQPGVCSDRGRCNHLNGLCSCRPEYYHGPKNACEYKHAPASKNGEIDNKCSERGVHDKIRGICNCGLQYFGSGCAQKKCPNSNGESPLSCAASTCDRESSTLGSYQAQYGRCAVPCSVCKCLHWPWGLQHRNWQVHMQTAISVSCMKHVP